MGAGTEPSETVGNLDEIELRRGFRNMFAHFAARAFQDDYLVFVTRSDFDAQQALGEPLGEDGMLVALIERSSAIWLNEHMDKHGRWLAAKSLEWRKRYLT